MNNDRIHVLQVISSLRCGGAETFLMNLFRRMDRNRFRFSFLLNQDGGTYLDEVRKEGADVYLIPPRRSGVCRYMRSLDRFFAAHKGHFDVVHQHLSSLTSIEPLMFARKYGVPVRVVHSHSSFPEGAVHRLLHYVNQLPVCYAANRYLACSEVSRKWTYKLASVRAQAQILMNGIETARFRYKADVRTAMRRKFGFTDDDIVIGHVGRFHPVKNHKFLVDILHECLRTASRARLVLVGRGDGLLDEVKARVRAYGMDDEVVFAGQQSDIAAFLQMFDVFVFPSIKEGLPLSLVEAQCAGLPVVASDSIDGMAGILDTYTSCSLERPAREWARLVLEKAKRPEAEREDAWQKVRSAKFDINDTVHSLEKIYGLG